MGWFLFRRSGLEVLEDYGPYVGLKRILDRIRRVQGFGDFGFNQGGKGFWKVPRVVQDGSG